MRSGLGLRATTAWHIARPAPPGPVARVSMAGFRDRCTDPIELPVVPHPSVTLVFECGGGTLVVRDATGRRHRGSLVAGLAPSAVRMQGQNIDCVEVRLSPVDAPAVLGAYLAELDHNVVALDDIWGREASRILDQLGETDLWDERFALIDALLTRRSAAGPMLNPEVAWVWERISLGCGSARVEDLATEVGWSRRRLWERFRAQVGLPPKRAAKLVRFHWAARCLTAGDSPARVAAKCGYTDQSHLHRDVVAFTGVTPAALAVDSGLAAHCAAE
ncbi:AraC family transcriptional regulator [Nocardia donostiensis]|uniref:helix-turn-helix domain-containing protein n=1 Tax=Nocardia donostiensis TaxID=1538463 RepID=UPI0009F0324A|nr:helix-turn-helix domain-containing protein [Nocardia donostiensis]OQS15032.1 AraC family transcriptional regulator [Nocardia donostiensis]